jgi:hypothetical protein
MTDLSRGARVRRGGRRPGWLLLTALLVLAIAASSALVFTNRVELLKLAVILALWAAVVAAFVSVIYRRQSDVDQARARDLKLVYDLQLDREISARREYELTVESQLRRELASELRAHAADEVAALRAELAALRTNLEILFDAELNDRPALETERKTVRGYSEWDRENESARERVNRVTSVRTEEPPRRADDSSIIDVPEEPLAPPPRQPAAGTYQAAYASYQAPEAYDAFGANRAAQPYETPDAGRGAHWRPGDQSTRAQPDQPSQAGVWDGQGVSAGRERQSEERGWAPVDQPSQTGSWTPPGAPPAGTAEQYEPEPPRRSRWDDATPPQQPEPRFAPPPPPQPQPEPQPPAWSPPTEAPRRRHAAADWQSVGSEGQWRPAGSPGSNWISEPGTNAGARPYEPAASADDASFQSPAFGEPISADPPSTERRGRHSSATEPEPSRVGEPETDWREAGRRARARHSAEHADTSIGASSIPPPAMSPPPPPTPPSPPPPPDTAPAMSPPAFRAARHRSSDPSSDADGPESGGHSVADLLARLQTSPSGGGRRRRREE